MNMETIAQPTGYILTAGDGKGVAIPDNHRMVKISEKKEGRGKGKTVAFVLIPAPVSISEEQMNAVQPMLQELLQDLQKDILTRMQRDGSKAVSAEEISITACIEEFNNRTFSADTVGMWFDTEVSDMLMFRILTAKGWNVETLGDVEKKFLEEKNAAYRASYCEVAKKFPSLNPAQCTELVRVLDLLECTGSISARIREKLTPKEVTSALGF